MEESYFVRALRNASEADRNLLQKFLSDDASKMQSIRNSVEENALIIEKKNGTNWRIAFYTRDDIADAIEFLKSGIGNHSCV